MSYWTWSLTFCCSEILFSKSVSSSLTNEFNTETTSRRKCFLRTSFLSLTVCCLFDLLALTSASFLFNNPVKTRRVKTGKASDLCYLFKSVLSFHEHTTEKKFIHRSVYLQEPRAVLAINHGRLVNVVWCVEHADGWAMEPRTQHWFFIILLHLHKHTCDSDLIKCALNRLVLRLQLHSYVHFKTAKSWRSSRIVNTLALIPHESRDGHRVVNWTLTQKHPRNKHCVLLRYGS